MNVRFVCVAAAHAVFDLCDFSGEVTTSTLLDMFIAQCEARLSTLLEPSTSRVGEATVSSSTSITFSTGEDIAAGIVSHFLKLWAMEFELLNTEPMTRLSLDQFPHNSHSDMTRFNISSSRNSRNKNV